MPDPGLGHDLTIGAAAATAAAMLTEAARIVLRWLARRLKVEEPDPRDEEIRWLRARLEHQERGDRQESAGDE